MKALLIGGTGPTGPHIVDGLLTTGYEVVVLHRGLHEVEFDGKVEHIHADPHFTETLTQALGRRQFDVTICTYGRLRHVLEAIKGHTARLVAVGGGSWMGGTNPEESPDELLIPRPRDVPIFGGRGGQFTDLMIVSQEIVMEAGRNDFFEAVMVHYPSWVFGPRCLYPREWCFIKRILDGRRRIIVPNDGMVLSSRGFGENLAHAVLLATTLKEAVGQVYNAADDHLIPLKEWVFMVADAMGKTIEVVGLPWEIAGPSCPYVDNNYHNVFDAGKIKAQLGYKDVVTPQEAIRKTVEWSLANRDYAAELGKNTGDRFDYETEDRLIRAYQNSIREIRREIPFPWERPPHPYPHPEVRGKRRN